jgi:hypothetical protein
MRKLFLLFGNQVLGSFDTFMNWGIPSSALWTPLLGPFISAPVWVCEVPWALLNRSAAKGFYLVTFTWQAHLRSAILRLCRCALNLCAAVQYKTSHIQHEAQVRFVMLFVVHLK